MKRDFLHSEFIRLCGLFEDIATQCPTRVEQKYWIVRNHRLFGITWQTLWVLYQEWLKEVGPRGGEE